MGPKRFGALGKLAFSYGNVAQDEGAAMAEYAYNVKHWKTAVTVTDNLLVYFKNIVQAFTSRYKQLGGSIVDAESFTSFDKTIGNVVSRVNPQKADVIVTSTGFADWPTFMAGIRSLNNQTPIMNSWAGDGTFWYPKSPPVSNYWYVTYASVFGDDPSAAGEADDRPTERAQASRRQREASSPARPRSTASPPRSSWRTARPREPCSRRSCRSSRACRRSPGKVSFSPTLHSVFGRAYRVMEVQNSKPKFVQLYTAKKLGTL